MSPHEVLGLATDASEEQVRAAYLAKVKEFPPDRDAGQFEKVRDAYDTLRDPRKRAKALFDGRPFEAPLAEMFKNLKPRRVFTGPKPWLEALKSK